MVAKYILHMHITAKLKALQAYLFCVGDFVMLHWLTSVLLYKYNEILCGISDKLRF